jgi:hypothetical protein
MAMEKVAALWVEDARQETMKRGARSLWSQQLKR